MSFVIARHSGFAFKNKSMDVRRAAGRVRTNAQVVGAFGSGGIPGPIALIEICPMSSLRAEVVAQIVEALLGKLAVGKVPDRKPPKSVEAMTFCSAGGF